MKSGFTALELIIVLACAGIAAAVLFPVLKRLNTPRERCSSPPSCQSMLKNIGLGFKQYTQDYDEKFPPSRDNGNRLGWGDAIMPYVKSASIFQCPQVNDLKAGDPPANNWYTDYWMNSRLARFREDRLASISNTVMAGDGDNEMSVGSPHYAISAIPSAWPADPASPFNRHLSGANFAFADGHVKWFKSDTPVLITPLKSYGSVTFAP